MADMRRRGTETSIGPLGIQLTPGSADETLPELARLLAEEGIDVDTIDVPNRATLATLQQALNSAVERHNVARFSSIGKPRELAVTMLRRVIDAIAENNTTVAAELLGQVQTESPDNSTATATADSCIGLALGLLDECLSGRDPEAPTCLAARVRPRAGHWSGKRAAADILALAGMGRAFRSLDTLFIRHGGPQVLYGSALALAATTQAWSQATGTPASELVRIIVR